MTSDKDRRIKDKQFDETADDSVRDDHGGWPIKAYRNLEFIRRRAGRPLRILSEFLEPEDRFEREDVSDTIVFFGSARIKSEQDAREALAAAKSSSGNISEAERALHLSRYYEDARELAKRLTEWSKSLEKTRRRFVICTGGGPGIMEAANRGASEARGLNIGLNIALPHEQEGNPYISRELAFEFHYFFMRKFWFAYLAKAMVVFPGGMGTLDEFFELVTLVQTKKMGKPIPMLLYGTEFWDKVINFDALVEFGTVSPQDLNLFYRCDTVDEAFTWLTGELERTALHDPGGSL